MKIGFISLFLALGITTACAQVRQSGTVTPGHPVMWTTNGVIQDAGPATAGFLTGLGVVASGPGICQNSGPITGPYNQICLSVTTGASNKILAQNFGGATPQSLQFVINGTTYNFPFTGPGTGVIGPVSSTVGDFACWNSTIGAALSDCAASVVAFHVPTNAALTAAATTTYPNGVWRDAFVSTISVAPLFYVPSNSACSLNSGNGDNGSQVKSSDSKCWLAQFPPLIDVFQFGAKGDGVTDDSGAFQAAINAAEAQLGGMVYCAPTKIFAIATGLTINTSFTGLTSQLASRSSHDGGTPPNDGCELFWTGAGGTTMLTVTSVSGAGNSRTNGNVISGIQFSCASTASIGLELLSLRGGSFQNLYFEDCTTTGLDTNVVAALAEARDTQGNTFSNIACRELEVSGNCMRLGGGSGANTSFNTIVSISGAINNATGLLFVNSDNNLVQMVDIVTVGTGAPITFSGDSNGNSSSNHIVHATGQVVALGTPTIPVASANNVIDALDSANSSPAPTIGTGATLTCHYDNGNQCGTSDWLNWTPTFTCTGASCSMGSVTVNSARYIKVGHLVIWHVRITITGAPTNPGGFVTISNPSGVTIPTLGYGTIQGWDSIVGKGLLGLCASGGCSYQNADGTFAGNNGSQQTVTAIYETTN